MSFNDGSHDLQKFPWSRFTFSTATFFSICPSLPTSFASLQFSSSISNSWSGIGRSLLKRIPIKQTLEAVIVPFSFPHVGRFHLFSSHSHFASSLHLAVMPHPDLGSEGLILYVKAYIFTWPHAFLCDAVAGGGSWTEGKKAELETNLRSRRSHFLPGLGGTWAGIAWGLGQGGRWLACNLMYACVLSLSKF